MRSLWPHLPHSRVVLERISPTHRRSRVLRADENVNGLSVLSMAPRSHERRQKHTGYEGRDATWQGSSCVGASRGLNKKGLNSPSFFCECASCRVRSPLWSLSWSRFPEGLQQVMEHEKQKSGSRRTCCGSRCATTRPRGNSATVAQSHDILTNLERWWQKQTQGGPLDGLPGACRSRMRSSPPTRPEETCNMFCRLGRARNASKSMWAGFLRH